jgi:hypothetical protein
MHLLCPNRGRLYTVVVLLPLAAQSSNSGTVTGTVADPSGAVVAGAQVQMRNPVTTYDHSETTSCQ